MKILIFLTILTVFVPFSAKAFGTSSITAQGVTVESLHPVVLCTALFLASKCIGAVDVKIDNQNVSYTCYDGICAPYLTASVISAPMKFLPKLQLRCYGVSTWCGFFWYFDTEAEKK